MAAGDIYTQTGGTPALAWADPATVIAANGRVLASVPSGGALVPQWMDAADAVSGRNNVLTVYDDLTLAHNRPAWLPLSAPPMVGLVWVTSGDDGVTPNIATFNLDGTEAAPIEIASFDVPSVIAVVHDGTNDAVWLLLSNLPDGTAGTSIVRLNYDGTVKDYLTDGYLGGSTGIAVSTDTVYVVNNDSPYPTAGQQNVSIYHLDGTSAGTPLAGGGAISGTRVALFIPTPEVWVGSGSTIYRMQPDGTPISSFTVHGSGFAYDMKVVGSDVWMSVLSGPIYRYSFSGTYIDTLTGDPTAHHRGLAVVPVVGGDEVWVADRDQQLLWRFSTGGAYLGTHISSTNLEAFGPLFLAVLPPVAVLAAWVLSTTGSFLTPLASLFTASGGVYGAPITNLNAVGGASGISGSAVVGGTEIWISNNGGPLSISRFTFAGAQSRAQFTTIGGTILAIYGMALVNGGAEVWLLQSAGFPHMSILRINATTDGIIGSPLTNTNMTAAQFLCAVGSEVWVPCNTVPTVGNAIVRWTVSGTIAGSPITCADFNNPQGICVVSSTLYGTSVWVTQLGSGNVVVLSTAGTELALLTGFSLSLHQPNDIKVVGAEVWIANSGNNTVSRVDPDTGTLIGVITGNSMDVPLFIAVMI